MNLVLCIIIVVLGVICTKRSGEFLPIYIGAAFGLFGISHAATLLGLKDYLTVPLIIVRFLAYILVIWALILYLRNAVVAKEAQQAWVDYFNEDEAVEDKG